MNIEDGVNIANAKGGEQELNIDGLNAEDEVKTEKVYMEDGVNMEEEVNPEKEVNAG